MSELSNHRSSNAPMWLVTFADLMSLLMCFFVLLLSFSTVDESKFKKMSTSLGHAFHTPPPTIVSVPVDPVKTTDPINHQVKIMRALLGSEIKQGLITVETDELNIIIRINEVVSFPSGSASLKAGFEPIMDKITAAIDNTSGIIHVAGHTDDNPISTDEFSSNWALSVARSVTVATYMLDNKEIAPERVVVEGHASTRPLITNDSVENRAKNRRVEIIISQDNVDISRLD